MAEDTQGMAKTSTRSLWKGKIEAFVDVDEVPFVYLETPYYTAPINQGEKVYALLREALQETGNAGLARVVIHREHPAKTTRAKRAA